MFFATVAFTGAVVLALSSGTAGIPSARLDTVAGSQRSASLIGAPEIFHSGSGYAKWANGSSVDFRATPAPPKATGDALQKRQTEIACYDVGTEVTDELANSLLTEWCEAVLGTELAGSILYGRYNLGNGQSLLLSITADSGCAFTVEPLNGCTFNFQQPLNDCNTAIDLKQGGAYSIPCSVWRIDPGTYFENGSDF